VVKMKRNDHYFPMVDWVKDPNEPIGWKRITYASPEADGVLEMAALELAAPY
jgi:pro-apoptotic serine protease NMA111